MRPRPHGPVRWQECPPSRKLLDYFRIGFWIVGDGVDATAFKIYASSAGIASERFEEGARRRSNQLNTAHGSQVEDRDEPRIIDDFSYR